MDSSSLGWLHQEPVIGGEEGGMDSSVSEMDILMACSSGPMLERRMMRPQQEQAVECPRCHSTHTKFCYYNNYSLSQPRYLCKTCRRYWTCGGTLRNIPVGGGCRKNKKSSSSSNKHKPSSNNNVEDDNKTSSPDPCANPIPTWTNNTGFQLMSFPEMMHLPHDNSNYHLPSMSSGSAGLFHHAGNRRLDAAGSIGNHENTLNPIDFIDSSCKSSSSLLVEDSASSSRNQLQLQQADFLRNINAEMGMMNVTTTTSPASAGLCSSYGLMCLAGNINSSTSMPMLPGCYHNHDNDDYRTIIINDNDDAITDVKPECTDALSLQWHDDSHDDPAPKHTFGYINEMGSWTTTSGFMR